MATPRRPGGGVVDRHAPVARRVVALLVERLVVRDVDHPRHAEERPVGVDHGRRVERPVAVALEEVEHGDDARRGAALAEAPSTVGPGMRLGVRRAPRAWRGAGDRTGVKASSAKATRSAPASAARSKAARPRRRLASRSGVAGCWTRARRIREAWCNGEGRKIGPLASEAAVSGFRLTPAATPGTFGLRLIDLS